ncbi:MAG: diguanylate cyclase [Candidatus Riflebacteria bacterium]|nr:diguanylate cyclase [Candidatus Riflebacteria bacterium]
MKNSKKTFIYKCNGLILLILVVGFLLSWLMGSPFNLPSFFIMSAFLLAGINALIYYKIILPLNKFAELADEVADGNLKNPELEINSELGELQNSFSKIVGSLIESREAIENYIKTIGESNVTISNINQQLEIKVNSLSLLYTASKAMGGSLSIDGLIRSLLTLIIEKLNLSGAAIMLYNDQTDMVYMKDLLGFSPELFARFRFYSDHRIIMEVLSGKGWWLPEEKDFELMKAEFESDLVRALTLFFPMKIKDHFVGLLLLGDQKSGQPYNDSDLQLIQALTGLATTSINNAALYERSEMTKNELDRKVFNLMTLQQSGRVLSSTLNLEELIAISIDMFLETVWSNRGVLMLVNEETTKLEVKAFKGLSREEVGKLETDPVEIWAMTTLQKEKRAILSHELAGKVILQNYTTIGKQLQFAVYLPLIKEGEITGVVKIGPKINGEPFTENDLEFFSTLASQAVIAFENARLYSLAITDSITKLYIHRYFQVRLDEEVKRSRRYNSTLTLLMIDIDHFKQINDTYGHQQGDMILKEISHILRRNIRSTDLAARYGGEEFVIILPETTQADAKIVAERIRRDVSGHEFSSFAQGQPPIAVTISVGVAGFPINANNKEELIQKADNSMYQAKGQGRNKVVLCGLN